MPLYPYPKDLDFNKQSVVSWTMRFILPGANVGKPIPGTATGTSSGTFALTIPSFAPYE